MMHINDVFAKNSKMQNILFYSNIKVCLFNLRISKTVRTHSETSNITKKNIAPLILDGFILLKIFENIIV